MGNKKQTGINKRIWGVVLSAALIVTSFGGTTADTSTQAEDTATDYGLADNIQDGTILHCFNWTYNQIKEELQNIAEAGFTAVQTSPVQPSNMDNVTSSNTYKTWWWLYQPLDFCIAENGELGTKSELEALCTEAENYGIKVIVDVVSNHLGNYSTANSEGYDSKGLSTNIPEKFRNNTNYWHTNYNVSMGSGSRTQSINYALSGLPDLNTENSDIQNYVIEYLEECIDVGVDGFRFDTAKHIGVPGDSSDGTTYTYWPNVISAATSYYKEKTNGELYCYGEILGTIDGDSSYKLMHEYTTYMSITDSTYGYNIRNAFSQSTVPTGFGSLCVSTNGGANINTDKLVYWAESHDTYSNGSDSGYSWNMTQNQIDRAYAIAASRDGATALYFSRPGNGATNKNDIKIGEKGSDAFKSKAVAAVNHFHNAMIGQDDYYTTNSNYAVVTREKGAVIVAGTGGNKAVTVPNADNVDNGIYGAESGTYIDEITGNIWTVTPTGITGTIGDTGIAVIYQLVSAVPGTETFTTPTLDVTLSVNSNTITSCTYTTSEGDEGTFTNGQVITIGGQTDVTDGINKEITVTLTAVGTDNKSYTYEYIYTKKASSKVTKIYFDNSSYNWTRVCAYIYSGAENNAVWPGEAMTYNEETGLYEYEVPEELQNSKVIFVDSGNTGNRYPPDDTTATNVGLDFSGTSMKFISGNRWIESTADDPVITKIDSLGTIDTTSVYFENTGNWSTVCAYIWDYGTSTKNAAWPGEKITDDIGNGIYKYSYSNVSSYAKPMIIFNNNNGTQTADLEYVAGGYYNNNGLVIDLKNGIVVVKHIDKDTEELIGNSVKTIMTDDINTEYTTSPQTIPGYVLAETPANATGRYTAGVTTVTYKYSKVGSVIARYVDESGISIAETEALTGAVGNKYETTQKTISGYKLKTTTDNTTGTYTEQPITVTYTYSVSDVEESSEESSKEESSEDESSEDSSEPETKVKGTVTVKHIYDGSVIATETITGYVGDNYTTNPLPNYNNYIVSGHQTGEFTESNITVTYTYTNVPTDETDGSISSSDEPINSNGEGGGSVTVNNIVGTVVPVSSFGNSVNIKISTPNGETLPAGYTCEYYYKKSTDSNWIQATTYGTTTELNIEFFILDDYQIKVSVKDNNNSQVYENYFSFTAG